MLTSVFPTNTLKVVAVLVRTGLLPSLSQGACAFSLVKIALNPPGLE